MLAFFPKPYPDEAWYSVLCRYHVRTGNRNSSTTFRELFHNREKGMRVNFLPDRGMVDIVAQLPKGVLDIEEIILEHTLLPYYYRFQSREVKAKALHEAKSGVLNFRKEVPRPNPYQELCYCPICVRTDREQYGEPYWHLSHQIPFATVCSKHGCRLIRRRVQPYIIDCNLLSPEDVSEEPDIQVSDTELYFTGLLVKYQQLPFKVGRNEGFNNLYEGLVNVGYGIARKKKEYHYSIDFERLERDLFECFGEQSIKQIFATDHLKAPHIGRFRRWSYFLPERYAIIAAFIRQDPEITFSGTKIENVLTTKFMELASSKIVRSKRKVAELLGVKSLNLDVMAYNLNVEPFWSNKAEVLRSKNQKLSVQLTEEQYRWLKEQTEKLALPSMNELIRICIDREIRKGLQG